LTIFGRINTHAIDVALPLATSIVHFGKLNYWRRTRTFSS